MKDEGWDKFWGNYDPGWLRRPSRDHKSEGGGATLPASHMVCFVEEKMLDAQTEWFFVFVLDLSSTEASVNIESWKSYMGTSYIYVWRWKSSHINKSFNANNDIYCNMKLIHVLSVLAFLYGRSWGTGCVALLTLWAVWKNPLWPFLRCLKASHGFPECPSGKVCPHRRRCDPACHAALTRRPANQPVATAPVPRTEVGGSRWRRRTHGSTPRMGELWNHWFWVTLALGQIHLLDQVSVQAWDKCFKSQSGSNWRALYHFTRQPFGF